jgi:hypothetical protein
VETRRSEAEVSELRRKQRTGRHTLAHWHAGGAAARVAVAVPLVLVAVGGATLGAAVVPLPAVCGGAESRER